MVATLFVLLTLLSISVILMMLSTTEYVNLFSRISSDDIALEEWQHAFSPVCTTTCSALTVELAIFPNNPFRVQITSFNGGEDYESATIIDTEHMYGLEDHLYCFNTGFYISHVWTLNTNNWLVGCPNSIIFPYSIDMYFSQIYPYTSINGLSFDGSYGLMFFEPPFYTTKGLQDLIVSNCMFSNFTWTNPRAGLFGGQWAVKNVFIYNNSFNNVFQLLSYYSSVTSVVISNNVFLNTSWGDVSLPI